MSGAAAGRPLVALVGPTGVGKTALAVALAHHLGAAELVNADSRQVLRGLRVGTNAPGPEDLQGVTCHLLGIAEPGEPFSVADWLAAARACLTSLRARGVGPILVGGTGLYVRALLEGWELSGPPPDPDRRRWLTAAAATPDGLARLGDELRHLDPEGAARLDLRNPRRVVRALERVEDRGSLAGGAARLPVPALRLGLDAPAALHRRWIAERARAMLAGGLVKEAGAALGRGISRSALAGAGIGYREALALLDGRLSPEAAVTEIERRTRRYAKAQRTWFRADPGVTWLVREGEDDLGRLADRAAALVARGSGPALGTSVRHIRLHGSPSRGTVGDAPPAPEVTRRHARRPQPAPAADPGLPPGARPHPRLPAHGPRDRPGGGPQLVVDGPEPPELPGGQGPYPPRPHQVPHRRGGGPRAAAAP